MEFFAQFYHYLLPVMTVLGGGVHHADSKAVYARYTQFFGEEFTSLKRYKIFPYISIKRVILLISLP